MCGIVGAVAERNITAILLEGLKRLEYRGYDSAGVAVFTNNGTLERMRRNGKVAELEQALAGEPLAGRLGIAHTRWATHGAPCERNAHPHFSGSDLAVVHNGIIENHEALREQLKGLGYVFTSDTDTEVIAHLLNHKLKDHNDLTAALKATVKELHGAYGLAVISAKQPDRLVAARSGSPLVIGLGLGENFLASDQLALRQVTDRFMYLEEGDIAEIRRDSVQIWDVNGQNVQRETVQYTDGAEAADKGEFRHYMLKEIHEQGAVLRATLKGRISPEGVDLAGELDWNDALMRSWKRIHVVACGTAYYASLAGQRVLERWTGMEVLSDIASEYRYRHLRADSDTLAIFVSQSGETADTLAALRKARSEGARCLAVTNVRGSTLAREVHDTLLLKAGPEIGVAATKTFMGQMATLYALALYLGLRRGAMLPAEVKRLAEGLLQLPYRVETLLARCDAPVQELAARYAQVRSFLFLGRGHSYPVALEGALKLKEISYVHAEAYAAGEMKHGPIALLEPELPVFVVAPRDSLYEKTISNIQEARARKAPVVAVGTEGDTLLPQHVEQVIPVPWSDEELTPFLTVIPLQLFAYHMARLRNCAIDQPRNLAKSVTVE